MEPVATGLTYDDLVALPDDHLRHELIHGEHYVTPAPHRPHQKVVVELTVRLHAWCAEHGGEVYVAPTDVVFADDTVLEPDLLVIAPHRIDQLVDPRYVEVAPDLVIEVSSPSTRSHDLVRKRRVYEEHGVAEFWFVDLDAARVEQYVLGDDRAYGAPAIVERGEQVTSTALDALSVEVNALFGVV